jgi:hypothetical protein
MDAATRHPELRQIVTAAEEFEAIMGESARHMVAKVISALDDICLGYIARSPFVIYSLLGCHRTR